MAHSLRYIVICRADSKPDGEKGEYVIATHRWFWSHELACQYAATIASGREPIVVEAYKDLRNE